MKDLGYESNNSVLVLGSITVFISFWILKVVSFLILLVSDKIFAKVFDKKYTSKLKRNLFWNGIIPTTLETYIELLIASNLNL